jgi:hypothetical protein
MLFIIDLIDPIICLSVDRSIDLSIYCTIIDRSVYNQPTTMVKKVYLQYNSTECLRATADDKINLNMDVVDKATAKLQSCKAETQEYE